MNSAIATAMPAPTRIKPESNIWVASGDGDLELVKNFVEGQGLSPNIPDQFTYTPMHAAASYGHIQVLEYLVSKGGNVNVTDGDNETPLYTVESVDVARWLIEHGAEWDRKNSEGITPVDYLAEDFPDVSAYLSSLGAQPSPAQADSQSARPASSVPPRHLNYVTDQSADALTSQLMDEVQGVMRRAEAEGHEPDDELRRLVGDTVLEGMLQGVQLSETADEDMRRGANGHNSGRGPADDEAPSSAGAKRSRIDD